MLPRPIPAWSPGVRLLDSAWLFSGGRGIVPLEGVLLGELEIETDLLGEFVGVWLADVSGFRDAVAVLDESAEAEADAEGVLVPVGWDVALGDEVEVGVAEVVAVAEAEEVEVADAELLDDDVAVAVGVALGEGIFGFRACEDK